MKICNQDDPGRRNAPCAYIRHQYRLPFRWVHGVIAQKPRPRQRPEHPVANQRDMSLGRFPAQRFPAQRFPAQRFPAQRFPAQRFPAQRFPAQRFPAQRFPAQRFPAQRFPAQRFPAQRFPAQRFPAQRFPDQRFNERPRSIQRLVRGFPIVAAVVWMVEKPGDAGVIVFYERWPVNLVQARGHLRSNARGCRQALSGADCLLFGAGDQSAQGFPAGFSSKLSGRSQTALRQGPRGRVLVWVNYGLGMSNQRQNHKNSV